MANNYTTRLKKRLPAPGDVNWDDEWHDNELIDEVVAGALLSNNRVVAGGAVSLGSGLTVDYAASDIWMAGKEYQIAAGSLTMTAAPVGQYLANWVYVNASGSVVASTVPPSGDYVPLALVDTDSSASIRVADLRPMIVTAPTAPIDAPGTRLANTEYVHLVAANNAPFDYRRGKLPPAIKGISNPSDRATLVTPRMRVADFELTLDSVLAAAELSLNSAASWDSVTPDYTVAANRAGKDFYLFLLTTGALVLSANAIAPTGHTPADSINLGGFHCLCASVGTISGHELTDFVAGDILPASVWDLLHRPVSSAAGMVFSASADIWVDIYLQSGSGTSTGSVWGATITSTRDWMSFVDDLAAVKKRLMHDHEFQVVATGSNERTTISGASPPVSTGGHIDTAGRRMISTIGCEDCCGALWQWLITQSYAVDIASFTFSWYPLPNNKGSIYKQEGPYGGDVKLLAGGSWENRTNVGSRCRRSADPRWAASASIGSRGCARRLS